MGTALTEADAPVSSTPSLRRLWSIYKKLLVETGMSRRDQVLAQTAFYSGARCVLQVLNPLVEGGDVVELQRVISRHARTIRALRGQTPRKRRH
jgi:hypothetical protein